MTQADRHPVDLPPGLDAQKLAEVALAILSLSKHDFGSVWKQLDWSLLNLLYKEGWIDEPVTKRKSVQLTKEGELRAAEFLRRHFAK